MVLGIILISYGNSKKILDSTYMIIHTQEVLTDLAGIKTDLIDLETGQRGFIITGKQKYLEPYNRSLEIIKNHVNNLRTITADNKGQTKRINLLTEMINAKLEELNNTIKFS